MAFYDIPKVRRDLLVQEIRENIRLDLSGTRREQSLAYYDDEDTYIRKSAYLATGRLYLQDETLRENILAFLETCSLDPSYKIRHSAMQAAGEIGIKDFEAIEYLLEKGLFDEHHSVRNAVIGALNKTGEKNPGPALRFARRFLHHPDKEIRREICHGIELRGRTHPQDILPLLAELQSDPTARVRNTLIHVIGQIAYKKGCLETVTGALRSWENKELVHKALEEIIDVHHRYRNFAVRTAEEARAYIEQHFGRTNAHH